MALLQPHPNPSPEERELGDLCEDYDLLKKNKDCTVDEKSISDDMEDKMFGYVLCSAPSLREFLVKEQA